MLAFSLVLAACSNGNGGDPDPDPDPDPTPTPGTSGEAVALIEDEDLDGKFFMMYTFEDEAAISAVPADGSTLAAIDPYTGEALTAKDGTYLSNDNSVALVSIPTANGGSKYVLNTNNNGISLGGLTETESLDEVDTNTSLVVADGDHSGLSISFWAYNYETIVGNSDSGVSADWNNLATVGGGLDILWGNVHRPADIYPTAGGTIVGRGAYTEASYAEAQAKLTTAQLGVHNDYTGWNAVAGNKGATDEDGGLIDNIADAYLNTWRYITVNIDYTEGVSFYNNGRLVFNYTPNTFLTDWNTFYSRFIIGMRSNFQEAVETIFVNMFNAHTNIYVDDVLVGTSLTAEQACALYEDLSGNTWDADDLTLGSDVVASTYIASETYSGAWYNAQSLAQTLLPTGDFNITYTADLYTARTNLWDGPEFCIVQQDRTGLNTPAAGGGMCIVISPNNNDQNLSSDILDADKNEDGSLKINFTTETTADTFKYTLDGEDLYTKTENGLTTVVRDATPVKLIVNIVREGNEWTVTYYQDEATADNILWAFTLQCSNTNQLVLNIGGDGCYMENIVISGADNLELTKTTSGTKTAGDFSDYTPVTAD